MEVFYSVILKGNPAGKVAVRRQGLYYLFTCRCRLNSDAIYRLIVCSEDRHENLGVLVPSEDGFVLNAKLPIKYIGTGDMSFYLTSSRDVHSGTFVLISPEEPFAYISRLKESFLERRNGQLGIQVSLK